MVTLRKVGDAGSDYVAAGGEYAVASELIFRGFNASIMSVDTGIDVVAVKDGKTYNVQVKTATLSVSGWFIFDIRMVSLDRHSASDVFYIFVLRQDNSSKYVILPASEIVKSIKSGAIYSLMRYEKYRVQFRYEDGRLFLGKKSNDVTYYLNNWESVK